MKAIRNNLLPIASIALLVLLSLIGLFSLAIGEIDFTQHIVLLVLGVVLVTALCFLKEVYLHKAAAVIYIAVCAVFCVQLALHGSDIRARFINIGDSFALSVAPLLSLSYLQVAKMIGKYSSISVKRFFLIFAVASFPAFLILAQLNTPSVVLAFFVCYITVIVLAKEKRVEASWIALITPVALAVLAVALLCTSSVQSIRLETIFTRGMNDPFGLGWTRTNLDGILMNTPLLGATTHAFEGASVVEVLAKWYDYNIVILLARYGWLAFFAVILAYVLFFICLFKMVHKIRQSAFARYTALIFALFLLVQALYSVIGLFLFEGAPMNMPFMGGGNTAVTVNYLSFGIVLSLYLRRNKPSEVKEIPYEDNFEEIETDESEIEEEEIELF